MSIYQCVNIQNGGPFTYPDGRQLPIHDKQQALAIPKGRLNVAGTRTTRRRKILEIQNCISDCSFQSMDTDKQKLEAHVCPTCYFDLRSYNPVIHLIYCQKKQKKKCFQTLPSKFLKVWRKVSMDRLILSPTSTFLLLMLLRRKKRSTA